MQIFANTPRRALPEGDEEDEVEEEDEEGPELDSSGDKIPAPMKRRRPLGGEQNNWDGDSRQSLLSGCLSR